MTAKTVLVLGGGVWEDSLRPITCGVCSGRSIGWKGTCNTRSLLPFSGVMTGDRKSRHIVWSFAELNFEVRWVDRAILVS
jgi:hypothetical protein